MFALSFLLVDPDVLGRPDKDSLPQHTLMEILIGDLDDRTCFRDKEGVFLEACAWSGVKCTADGDAFPSIGTQTMDGTSLVKTAQSRTVDPSTSAGSRRT